MRPEPSSKGDEREITHWKARPFIILIVSFFVFMAITFVVIGGLTKSWAHGVWPARGPVESPQSTAGWNTVTPQLQTDTESDLLRLRKQEYQQLHATRWADDSHTYAVIPIEQAMGMVTTAAANHQLNQLLPEPKPATPLELQNQKSGEAKAL